MNSGLTPMCLNPARVPPGTRKLIVCIQDIVVGATLVCLKTTGSAVRDKEYTVMSVSPTRVELSARGSKFGIKTGLAMQNFERRYGPVVKESIRRGLQVKATYEGPGYKRGDVITLVETGGRVYDFRDAHDQKGSVEKEALYTSFVYV